MEICFNVLEEQQGGQCSSKELELLRVMGLFIVLIVAVISQVGLYVKTSKIVYFALCQSYFSKVILKVIATTN